MSWSLWYQGWPVFVEKGSPLSGHRGHKGIPGKRGGSLPAMVQPTGSEVSQQVAGTVVRVFNEKGEALQECMEQGDATCPGAAWGLAKAIEADHGLDVEVIGGEFGTGYDVISHYWVEVGKGKERYIVDIGNNGDALETGKLRPIMVPTDSDFGKLYGARDEWHGTPKEFLRSQAESPWARASLKIFVGRV